MGTPTKLAAIVAKRLVAVSHGVPKTMLNRANDERMTLRRGGRNSIENGTDHSCWWPNACYSRAKLSASLITISWLIGIAAMTGH